MRFNALIRKRCSIRSYTDKPISEEMLHQILEAGQLAPTACNLQPFRFVVVQEKENLAALAASYPAPWFAEAPVVIAVCTQPDKAWTRKKHDDKNYADVDGAIAADHMILAAEELGLGTCWVGAFNPKIAAKVLKLPRSVELLTMITLGHPNEIGRPKERKDLKKIICRETWAHE